MRTLIIMAIGLSLMALSLRIVAPARRRVAAWVFSGLWLLAVLFNLRTGLSHGYGLREELPIQLLLFGIPVMAAWWFSRTPR